MGSENNANFLFCRIFLTRTGERNDGGRCWPEGKSRRAAAGASVPLRSNSLENALGLGPVAARSRFFEADAVSGGEWPKKVLQE
jgi:hypothetical protein